MTASEEWLRQQPAKDRGEPQVEAQPGEGTPHSHQAPSRASNLGKSHELSTSPPSSPRASAALSGGGGGSTAAASPPPGAAAAAAATGLLLQKHLAFPDWQAEATFRLFNARCCCLSELGLVGLQLVGWMAAAGRAVEIRSWRIVARVSLLVLAPTLAQLWLILYAPYTYRSHRCVTGGPAVSWHSPQAAQSCCRQVAARLPHGASQLLSPHAPTRCRQWLSMATRAPFDAWLVFTQVGCAGGACTVPALQIEAWVWMCPPARHTRGCIPGAGRPQRSAHTSPPPAWQDASVLGFGGALISRGMPHQAKLLMVMVRAVYGGPGRDCGPARPAVLFVSKESWRVRCCQRS